MILDDAPLAGLRIIEVSSFVAAPLGGMTLAQLGAEVIRVDPLGGAPGTTRWPLAPNGGSLYWAGLTRASAPSPSTSAPPTASARSRTSSLVRT